MPKWTMALVVASLSALSLPTGEQTSRRTAHKIDVQTRGRHTDLPARVKQPWFQERHGTTLGGKDSGARYTAQARPVCHLSARSTSAPFNRSVKKQWVARREKIIPFYQANRLTITDAMYKQHPGLEAESYSI
jgi:hypothetical protein